MFILGEKHSEWQFLFAQEYLINQYNYNDFNSYTRHGIFSIQQAKDKLNTPDSFSINGFLMNFAWELPRSEQVYFGGYPNICIYIRIYDGNGWRSWVQIFREE